MITILTSRTVSNKVDTDFIPIFDAILTDLVSVYSHTFSTEYPYTKQGTWQNFVAPTTSAVLSTEFPLYDLVDPTDGAFSDLSTQNFVPYITITVASQIRLFVIAL